MTMINVGEPEFVKNLQQLMTTTPIEDMRTYLRWQLTRAAAPLLSTPFVNENFAFYSAYLRGVQEQQPRWKRCVAWVDRDLGEALGQVFVRKAFPPDRKAATVEMVRQIEGAMEQRIKDLPWMGAATKEQAEDFVQYLAAPPLNLSEKDITDYVDRRMGK